MYCRHVKTSVCLEKGCMRHNAMIDLVSFFHLSRRKMEKLQVTKAITRHFQKGKVPATTIQLEEYD